MPAAHSESEYLPALRLRRGVERSSGMWQTTWRYLHRSYASLQMMAGNDENFNSKKAAQAGSHFLFAASRSTNATSAPFFSSFASLSTSQLVRRTQPCDSDLLTFEGLGVP